MKIVKKKNNKLIIIKPQTHKESYNNNNKTSLFFLQTPLIKLIIFCTFLRNSNNCGLIKMQCKMTHILFFKNDDIIVTLKI